MIGLSIVRALLAFTVTQNFRDFYLYFAVQQLVMTCVDFLLPTFSTISAAVSCMVLRWCVEPSVLRRIQTEIDAVVGGSRLPNLDDRVK